MSTRRLIFGHSSEVVCYNLIMISS